jgi:hypothetical protein
VQSDATPIIRFHYQKGSESARNNAETGFASP